ncbi:hypothetical protein ACSQ67_022121 [Phaseolus vulgaris]
MRLMKSQSSYEYQFNFFCHVSSDLRFCRCQIFQFLLEQHHHTVVVVPVWNLEVRGAFTLSAKLFCCFFIGVRGINV